MRTFSVDAVDLNAVHTALVIAAPLLLSSLHLLQLEA
jgi:hypothetical protein